MNYAETLAYLYEQLPMFQRIGPAAFKKDLSNTWALMDELGHPERQFRSVHVGGTNGKGSVSHMLAAILQAAGWKVGLYTSPHYKDFRERIKINGQLAERKYVVEFVRQHRPFIEALKPSFFEITVAMAFDYFARQNVDVAVVEVGMGGRLDSTNVLTPLLSVITNISYDHMQFLGDTLELIAGEKAGIIKPGVPVVIGETQSETRPVFEAQARTCRSPILFADQMYEARPGKPLLLHREYQIHRMGKTHLPNLLVNALGAYQQFNLQTALQAVETLPNEFQLDESAVRQGLYELRKLTRFLGRWQILGRRPTILADSAHNIGGVALAAKQLLEIPHHHLHIVWGSVADKDPLPLLGLLPRQASYYFVRPDVPRGLDAEELREKARSLGLSGKSYRSVANGLRAAKRKAGPEDLIFIGGSIFVVAEVV